MTFHNVRLPEDVEKGAIGGPGFKTTITELSSGFEKRNIDWERSRGKWDISYGLDQKSNQEATLAFFYARQGRANSFRFKDWTDYQIGDASNTIPQTVDIADGVATQFQLVRAYVSGAFTFNRIITRPVSGTETIYVDGILEPTATLDADTGVITFLSPPANSAVIGAICEFDNPARFDTDQLDLRAERDELYSIPSVMIFEVREVIVQI